MNRESKRISDRNAANSAEIGRTQAADLGDGPGAESHDNRTEEQ